MDVPGSVISVELARSLQTAGLSWDPANGDRFVVDAPELLGEQFVLSTMTVDVRSFRTGTVLAFNGTTEWALDQVAVTDTVWLPAESQLRELVGAAFTALTHDEAGWCVELSVAGAPISFTSPDAAGAYGRALLHLLTR